MIEQRRYARAPISAPVSFSVKGQPDKRAGVAKDVSIGGMSVETAAPGAFGNEVIIHVVLPGSGEVHALPGVVRWVRGGAMGVQFGLLGALETHLITEINRKHAEATGG